MPEFLFIGRQTKLLTPLTEVLHGWLSVDERLKAARDEMAELRERFVQTGATRRVAAFLLQRLEPASDQHTTDDGTHSRPAIAA
jgi:hypothetical protein